MSLFVLSDTHLSTTVSKPMDVFGCRWENYQTKIQERWNNTISENDTVIIGGDISWAMNLPEALADFKFIDKLNGKKLLGKGNHDFWWDTVTKMKRFLKDNDICSIDFLYNNSFLIDGLPVSGTRGWFYDKKYSPSGADFEKMILREALRIDLSIKDCIERYNQLPFVFLHFPPVFQNYECREILNVLHKYGIKKCYYGHIHNIYNIPPSFEYEEIEFIITSADYLDFIPLKVE